MHRFIRQTVAQPVCFHNKVLWHPAQCNYTMMDSTALIMERLCAIGSPGWIISHILIAESQSCYTLINKTMLTSTHGSKDNLSYHCVARQTSGLQPCSETSSSDFLYCVTSWIMASAVGIQILTWWAEVKEALRNAAWWRLWPSHAPTSRLGPPKTLQSKWAPSIKPHDTKSTTRNVPCISFGQKAHFTWKLPNCQQPTMAGLNKAPTENDNVSVLFLTLTCLLGTLRGKVTRSFSLRGSHFKIQISRNRAAPF